MESTLASNWLNQYKNRQPIFNHLFLFFIAIAFVLSDWIYGAFTFTELILGVLVAILFLAGKYRIHMHQFKWVMSPIIIISLHSFVLYLLQDDFNLKISIIALIKLTFYILVVVGLYNFIKVQKLEKEFMIWNNVAAILILILGVYIAVAVYIETNTEQTVPYEFLLHFTRLDGHLYRWDIPIVRMKSIFQEPAHLGYYLNSILLMNMLNKIDLRMKKWVNSLLIVGIILTFSYSSVFIMLTIMVLWLLFNFKHIKSKLRWKPSVLISLFLVFAVIFIFREFIYTTLIQRTIEIITGSETSGYERLVVSWRYINKETLLLGYGFLQSPGTLWNVFAYVFTELGLTLFITYIFAIGYLMKYNIPIALVFILMNFAKGGYLSSSYWFLILLVVIYSAYHYETLYAVDRKGERREKKRRF